MILSARTMDPDMMHAFRMANCSATVPGKTLAVILKVFMPGCGRMMGFLLPVLASDSVAVATELCCLLNMEVCFNNACVLLLLMR